jgi:hypothetical protein
MTSAQWLSKTNRKKWHGQSDKDRSTPLQQVELWVATYENSKTPANLEGLSAELNAWVGGKTKHGQISTIRDHQNAVSDLKRDVDAAMRLDHPLPWQEEYPGIFVANDL